MRAAKMVLICLVALVVVVAPAIAQEGHPLKGSWLGDFGPNKTDRTQVFIVMDWDGKAVTGMINPGTDNTPLRVANLIPPPPPPPPPPPAAGGAEGGRGNRGGGGGGGAAAGGQGGARGGGAAAPAGGAAAPAGGAAAPAAGARGAQDNSATLGNQAGRGPATPPPPPQDWLVHLEADGKDKSGAAVKYVIDGKIENLGLYNRSIVGTWTVGSVKNDFRLQRQ